MEKIDIYIPENHPKFEELKRTILSNLAENGSIFCVGLVPNFAVITGSCSRDIYNTFVKKGKEFNFHVYDNFHVGSDHCLFPFLTDEEKEEILLEEQENE